MIRNEMAISCGVDSAGPWSHQIAYKIIDGAMKDRWAL